jgi:negative regulator of sigma E activity
VPNSRMDSAANTLMVAKTLMTRLKRMPMRRTTTQSAITTCAQDVVVVLVQLLSGCSLLHEPVV